MHKRMKRCISVFFLAASVFSSCVQAGVVITGTRIIYRANQRETGIELTNAGKVPALVQAWVDDGRVDVRPDQIEVPFILMPPISRIEPGKGQTMRLQFVGDDLPKDRESVYWFNLLDIPPKSMDLQGENRLELAFRTRIKIFYRPTSLTSDPIAQLPQLSWKLLPADEEGGARLQVNNPSAYYISFADINVEVDSKKIELGMGMVPPFGNVSFVPKQGELPVNGSVKVNYLPMNDYGAAKWVTIDATS